MKFFKNIIFSKVTSRFAQRILVFFLLVTCHLSLVTYSYAIVDPLSAPNNKFGIHIISASMDEAKPAAQLVNSSGGDWGYVTVLVESKNRDHDKWQKFFDDLRREHLIPIVRLATQPDNGNWKHPYEGEEEAWAGFLNSLVWPVKNRYIIVYNEPNHGQEWAGTVDPADYAKILDKTISALKKKSPDFFILNAGMDAAAPNQPPSYMDEAVYLKAMNEAVPGIFEKLDGWSSHSYPYGFVGSPDGTGRQTVRTWFWELQTLRSMGVGKDLPVFITETGWKHAEGLTFDRTLPSSETVSNYYTEAFKSAWTSSRIVAVTPFLLNYQDAPFDHFSFKKVTGQGQNEKILGAQYPEYYDSFDKIALLPKLTGYPQQETKVELTKGEIYKSLVAEQTYNIPLTFKNTGQSIWNERTSVKLTAVEGGKDLNIEPTQIPSGKTVEPGQDYTFVLKLKAPEAGQFKVKLALFFGNDQFKEKTWDFYTEIKTPVILKIKSKLKWKKDFSGDYILSVKGAAGDTQKSIVLSKDGTSPDIEARYLLPGYKFQFTLSKPYYQGVTIERPVTSGSNTLDFGTLDPDFGSALFNIGEIWKLSPFSR